MIKGNKKLFVLYALVVSFIVVLLFLFNPTSILIEPKITPLEFLQGKPYIVLFNGITVIVPTSTFFVYLLGVQILYFGVKLIKNNKNIWGISLIFWGIGTLLAGTSYQGLGYELKCDGNTYCEFTSGFELSYLFITAISISVMAIAFSRDFLDLSKQKALELYAKIALGIYTIILMLGSILENSLLISYEIFSLFFMPLFVVFFVINISNYRKEKDQLNKSFIKVWIFFLVVNVLYYVYYIPGFTESLYSNTGIWFSANDVLHIGLIFWFFYFQSKIIKHENLDNQ